MLDVRVLKFPPSSFHSLGPLYDIKLAIVCTNFWYAESRPIWEASVHIMFAECFCKEWIKSLEVNCLYIDA